MVRKDVLEEQIVNAIVEELSKKPIMDDMVAELLKEQNRQCAENTKVSLMKRQKAKVDKALENLVMALEQGIMSATTNKRLHELEKQQAELERDILMEQGNHQDPRECAPRILRRSLEAGGGADGQSACQSDRALQRPHRNTIEYAIEKRPRYG